MKVLMQPQHEKTTTMHQRKQNARMKVLMQLQHKKTTTMHQRKENARMKVLMQLQHKKQQQCIKDKKMPTSAAEFYYNVP